MGHCKYLHSIWRYYRTNGNIYSGGFLESNETMSNFTKKECEKHPILNGTEVVLSQTKNASHEYLTGIDLEPLFQTNFEAQWFLDSSM